MNNWKLIEEEYEVLKIMGKGSQGQVAKAKHRESGQIFAIKWITGAF